MPKGKVKRSISKRGTKYKAVRQLFNSKWLITNNHWFSLKKRKSKFVKITTVFGDSRLNGVNRGKKK